MEPAGQEDRDERRRMPIAFAAGLIIIAVVVGGIVLLTHSKQPALQQELKTLPFGPDEKAYASQIHFPGMQLYRSSNLLNQQFTYVATTISNAGSRPISELEVTLEFHDAFNQVDLRDTERVLTTADPALAAGEKRDFQIVFEHIPTDWNRQYPDIRVAGLLLK